MSRARNSLHEEWAILTLQKIIDLDRSSHDALPGSVVKHVKEAQIILKKRRHAVMKGARSEQ